LIILAFLIASNVNPGLKPDDRSEDITITFRDAIVRLSSLSVRSVVRQQQHSRRWGEASTPSPISYNIWDSLLAALSDADATDTSSAAYALVPAGAWNAASD